MYLDIRLFDKEHKHINDQAIYSTASNLTHSRCNKHGLLLSAIHEGA